MIILEIFVKNEIIDIIFIRVIKMYIKIIFQTFVYLYYDNIYANNFVKIRKLNKNDKITYYLMG